MNDCIKPWKYFHDKKLNKKGVVSDVIGPVLHPVKTAKCFFVQMMRVIIFCRNVCVESPASYQKRKLNRSADLFIGV